MTQTGYTNLIVNTMLGWLKMLAGWVLRLLNLSGGLSPFEFLAKNWAKLLVILLIAGIVIDFVVWIFRWRPHWVWFSKKRFVINDKNFFSRENYTDDDDLSDATRGTYVKPRRDWVDNDFIVKARPAKKAVAAAENKALESEEDAVNDGDVFMDEKFNVVGERRFADRYEDEVFNVEDLPESSAGISRKERRRSKSGSEKK